MFLFIGTVNFQHIRFTTAPTPVPTPAPLIDNTELPATLSPAAPTDCNVATTPPAPTGPIADIIEAAHDPATMPPVPKPIADTISGAATTVTTPPTTAPPPTISPVLRYDDMVGSHSHSSDPTANFNNPNTTTKNMTFIMTSVMSSSSSDCYSIVYVFCLAIGYVNTLIPVIDSHRTVAHALI